MTKNISLNLKEVLKFHEDGWLGPFNLIDEKQMKIIEKSKKGPKLALVEEVISIEQMNNEIYVSFIIKENY